MSATLLLSVTVGDIMGSDSPEQSTSTHPYPGDGGERRFLGDRKNEDTVKKISHKYLDTKIEVNRTYLSLDR